MGLARRHDDVRAPDRQALEELEQRTDVAKVPSGGRHRGDDVVLVVDGADPAKAAHYQQREQGVRRIAHLKGPDPAPDEPREPGHADHSVPQPFDHQTGEARPFERAQIHNVDSFDGATSRCVAAHGRTDDLHTVTGVPHRTRLLPDAPVIWNREVEDDDHMSASVVTEMSSSHPRHDIEHAIRGRR